MAELSFRCTGATAASATVNPQIDLSVEVSADSPAQRIDSILLRCSVRIDVGRRVHTDHERERLRELFGEGSVWARSARSLLWTNLTVAVPPFTGQTSVVLALPCSLELASAASKYLRALDSEGPAIPVSAHFSGTVFQRQSERLEVSQIPWDREAHTSLSAALFREALDRHFPEAGLLSVSRELFERLDRYRTQRHLTNWEDTMRHLLAAGEGRPS